MSKTIVQLQDTDYVKATLSGDDCLVLDIGDSLRIFCRRETSATLFSDLVELAGPIITSKQEKQNDTDTE